MSVTVILVGVMAWTTLSIVVVIAVSDPLHFCGRRDGLVPIASGEVLRKPV